MVAMAAATAIEARLSAASDAPVVGINLTGAAPQDGSRYLLVQYPLTNSSLISVGDPGNNTWRDEGVARVVIHEPAGAGLPDVLTRADAIAALFRGKQFDGVTCWGPTVGPIDDRNDQGAYYLLTVAIPYQFDHFG